MEGNQAFAGGVGGALCGGQIGPSAIGTLRGEEFFDGLLGCGFVSSCPGEAGNAPAAVFVVVGVRVGEPVCGEANRLAIFVCVGFGSVELKGVHGSRSLTDVVEADGRTVVCMLCGPFAVVVLTQRM